MLLQKDFTKLETVSINRSSQVSSQNLWFNKHILIVDSVVNFPNFPKKYQFCRSISKRILSYEYHLDNGLVLMGSVNALNTPDLKKKTKL